MPVGSPGDRAARESGEESGRQRETGAGGVKARWSGGSGRDLKRSLDMGEGRRRGEGCSHGDSVKKETGNP